MYNIMDITIKTHRDMRYEVLIVSRILSYRGLVLPTRPILWWALVQYDLWIRY